MDWSQVAVSRDRILGDSVSTGSFPNFWTATPPIDPYASSRNVNYNSARIYRRCWDVVVPNWKEHVNSGKIILNDLVELNAQATYEPLTFTSDLQWPKAPYVTHYGNADLLGLPNGVLDLVPSVVNLADVTASMATDGGSIRAEALTTAYARVDVSELEVLASLGEMPETVDWFRDVLKRLIAAMAALKKRQYVETFNQLKKSLRTSRSRRKALKGTGSATEDVWMEWRYAIRPLIFEVQAYLAALSTRVESETRKTARKSSYDYTRSTSTSTTLSTTIYSANVQQEITTTRHIRAGVMYSLDPELTGWWTHLGLDAPVSAFWAITRLSFVLDWFFNIGQWIASWEPRLGLSPLASWVVETRSTETIGTVTGVNPLGYPPCTVLSRSVTDYGGYSCKSQVKMRWSNPTRQILPTFTYKGLDTAKVADLVVIGRKLASQLLR